MEDIYRDDIEICKRYRWNLERWKRDIVDI